jgi:hypothetical protein
MADLFGDGPSSSLAQLLESLSPLPGGPLARGIPGHGMKAPASSMLGGLLARPRTSSGLLDAIEAVRRRSAWNDRFEHWQRPASDTEETKIGRAWSNVETAISDNHWLNEQGVRIAPQGSYHNNTNVRTEADIDLRAVHRLLKVEYAPDVVQEAARGCLGDSDSSLTFQHIFGRMRSELSGDLSRSFGPGNVVVGKKAIRIKGITGSRAEVDVVPAVGFQYVAWDRTLSRYFTTGGITILSTDNAWTLNFPEQHTANGNAKRDRTRHRFKKVVRILKRMRADMNDRGILTVSVPSFLVECLVYLVEDWYFLADGDDRYSRVRRVSLRIQELLSDPVAAHSLREMNEVKLLFHPGQAWTYSDALVFANAVVAYLGNA